MKNVYESPIMITLEFSEEIMSVSFGDNYGSLLPGWGDPS